MTYFDGWIVWMGRAKKSKNTILSYAKDTEQLLIHLFGTLENQMSGAYVSVDSDKCYEYFDGNGLSPASVGRKISAMRSFYTYLIKEKKIINSNPFDGMVRPALPKPKPKALSEERTLEIMAKAYEAKYSGRNGMRDHALMTIFMTVPVRKSEVQNLRRADYTEDGVLVIDEAKGNENREIPCTAEMIEAIDEYLETRTDDYEWLFVSERGNRMSAHAIDNVIHKYAGINPHALRSTSATNLFRHDIPIATIKEIGGWDQGSNTFERTYLRIDNKVKRKAIEESMKKLRGGK